MDAFLKYFYQDFGLIVEALANIIFSIFSAFNTIFNFPMRMNIINTYSDDLGTVGWAMVIVSNIILVILAVILMIIIVKALRRVFKFRAPVSENEKLKNEVARLQRSLLKMGYEKDKILAMKMTEHGIEPSETMLPGMNEEGEEGEAGEEGELEEYYAPDRNNMEKPPIDPENSRFFRLTTVDNYYKTEYQPPEYDDDINLEELCVRFQYFAGSRLKLFYEIETVRWFISALGSCRLIILQGISGTGKTSLAYAFGKFFQNDSTIAAVQPSWRERTELFGYFNEFTKKFSETDFLRAVYEDNFKKDPHIVVLDEMNIARVEYYFAEMLSVLEMPRPEEWKVDIVTTVWDNDPVQIDGGKILVSANTWFLGTINNDDSTFAVADKVYDRAIPIDLDSKAPLLDVPDTDPVHITTEHLNALFARANQDFPVNKDIMNKIDLLDSYLIKHFRLAFGNRIIKQIKAFIPIYVACGGLEVDALDFMIAKKVLRKFESLNLGVIRGEIDKFIKYLDRMFGKENFKICKEYLRRVEKMS